MSHAMLDTMLQNHLPFLRDSIVSKGQVFYLAALLE